MIYDFSGREKNIIHYLSVNDSFVMAKQLSSITGVSERTIHSDIKKINLVLHYEDLDDAFELVSCHTKGYKFEIYDLEQFKQFIKDLDYNADSMEKELVNFRGREIRLLAILTNSLSLYRLSQILFLSEQALSVLIKKSNQKARGRQYEVKIVDKKIKIISDERDIRIAALNTIYVNPEYKGFTKNVLNYIVDEFFESNVLEVIQQVFSSNEQITLPMVSFKYISKLLFISYRRNQFGELIHFSQLEKEMLQWYNVELSISKEILRLLKYKFNYVFLEEDIYFLVLIIVAFSNRRDLVIQEMDNESYDLCKFVMNLIVEDFNLDKQQLEDSFMEDLSLFFWSFKVRIYFGISRQYMGETRVKRKLIVASEYSRKIIDALEKKTGYKIPDKEIIFLAVCIASCVEKGKIIQKQDILVASKYGICEAKRYQNQLLNNFVKNINSVNVCELYEINRYYDDVDLILTDDKSLEGIKEKLIFYRPYSTVNTMPKELLLKIGQVYDKSWLYHNLNLDCFITGIKVNSKEELFIYSANYIIENRNQRQAFVDYLLLEDKKLTFECGYRNAFFAMIDPNVQNSKIFFMVLNDAISWNQRFVQNFIIIKAKNYIDLQHYEAGLEELLISHEKCSLLIGEPNCNTLQKILHIEK